MDIFLFIIMAALGLIITFFSMKANSPVFALFGGLLIILAGSSTMYDGVKVPMVALTINETGNFTTETVETSITNGLIGNVALGLPVLLLGIYILYASSLKLYGK
jgi:hypothetical protein